jgi:hypothetical protein
VELPGRVRLEAGEEEEALAAHLHDDVLRQRGLRAARLEELADEPLVALGLAEVLAIGRGELWVAGDLWRGCGAARALADGPLVRRGPY